MQCISMKCSHTFVHLHLHLSGCAHRFAYLVFPSFLVHNYDLSGFILRLLGLVSHQYYAEMG